MCFQNGRIPLNFFLTVKRFLNFLGKVSFFPRFQLDCYMHDAELLVYIDHRKSCQLLH